VATYTTLEYDSVEKSFADWGFALNSVTGSFYSMAQDTITALMVGAAIDDEPAFPFEASVIIRTGRTSNDGTPGSFDSESGRVELRGKRMLTLLDARPEMEGVQYTFAGPWYDLENIAFQQKRESFVSWDAGVPVLESKYITDVFLFTKYTLINNVFDWVSIPTDEQIEEILEFCRGTYEEGSEPFLIGDIDPSVNVPPYQIGEVMCAEAIRMCLRAAPDCTVYFDYETAPPTIHVKRRGNLTPVTLPVRSGGHAGLQLTPRPDLIPQSVVIYFEQTHQVDGQSWVSYFKGKYGKDEFGEVGAFKGPDAGLRVLVQTIRVSGSNTVTGYLETIPFGADAVAEEDRIAWWERRITILENEDRIKNLTIGQPTVLDDDGNIVIPLANELIDGSGIADWMTINGDPVIGQTVQVTAECSYDEFDTGGNLNVAKHKSKELSTRITLTNGVTANYSKVIDPGQAIPANLAKELYDALSQLQYEGSDIRVAEPSPNSVTLANTLNLDTGTALHPWLTMGAQVQSITRDYSNGTTSVSIGPPTHLSAGEFTELFNFNRFRRVGDSPLVLGGKV